MLLIHPLCAYLTSVNGVQWRGADYDARFVALAVKGKLERLNGYYAYPNGDGTTRRVHANSEGRDFLRECFGNYAAGKLRDWGYTSPTIVPVPNSFVTPTTGDDFPTAQIAKAVADAFGAHASVAPILRFTEPVQPAHEGGLRSVEYYQSMMTVTSTVRIDQLVLLDDIITTGCHLKAAKARLATLTSEISHAVVCGESTPHQLADPFAVAASDLENPFGMQVDDLGI